MSMSSVPLVVGAKGRAADLEGQWNSYHKQIEPDEKVHNRGSKGYEKLLCVCYDEEEKGWTKRTAGCRAHLLIKPVDKHNLDGDWIVSSVDLVHTCGPDAKRRKRQIQTKKVGKINPGAVLGYTTTDKKKGNTKQFQKIVKAVTGVAMLTGQANNHIHNISHDKLHQQIAQYCWIPSIIDNIFKDDDPDGTYVCEHKPCRWDSSKKQFHRCYVCPSFTKHLWKEGEIRMIVADGTFMKGLDFKHTVLLAVTFDAENKIVVLAAAIVPVEDSDNWVWFHGNIRVDLPGFKVFMSDADKGITSQEFTLSQEQAEAERSRCTRHLTTNCQEKVKGKFGDRLKENIITLAKSRTIPVYNQRLAEIKHVHSKAADWLDERKNEFVAYTFIMRGLIRWGKVTSNGVENANSAILPLRYEPIAYLLLELVMYMQDKYIKGKERVQLLVSENKIVTNYASQINLGNSAKATTLPVTVVEDTRQEEGCSVVRARVGLKANAPVTATYEVCVDTENHLAECPCCLYKELGIHCAHVKALLLYIKEDPNGLDWTHKRYHVTNYVECYKARVPAFATAGKLTFDETMVPPEYKKPPGRPKSDRSNRGNFQSKTGIKRKCGACGQFGHFHKKCQQPSTEYRYNNNIAKARKWAKSQQNIVVALDPTHDNEVI